MLAAIFAFFGLTYAFGLGIRWGARALRISPSVEAVARVTLAAQPLP
jgi:hypothetical protein